MRKDTNIAVGLQIDDKSGEKRTDRDFARVRAAERPGRTNWTYKPDKRKGPGDGAGPCCVVAGRDR
jgi:hypothetical protein